MLSDYERVSLQLQAAQVGLLTQVVMPDSAKTRRDAVVLGRQAIEAALHVLEEDLAAAEFENQRDHSSTD